jgi:capsular polysaccharide transport system permease protein
VSALVLREMATTYGRTPGGYLWAVLEPAAGIALLTVVFSLAFHAPPLGDSFPAFYATGLLPYTLYVQMNTKLMVAIWFSKPLLQYPAVSYIDALLSRFLLTLMTQIVVFYVVLAGLVALFEPQISLRADRIALSLAMAAVFGAGIGVLNCLLISVQPVWQRVWNILHRPMFLISAIFYVFEAVPEPYRSLLWYNPLVHVVGMMRSGFYPTYDAVYVSPAYVFGLGLGALVTGLFFLRRWHKDLICA